MIINIEKIREFKQEGKNCYILTLQDNSSFNDTPIVIKNSSYIIDIYCKSFILTHNIETKETYLNNIHKVYKEKITLFLKILYSRLKYIQQLIKT